MSVSLTDAGFGGGRIGRDPLDMYLLYVVA